VLLKNVRYTVPSFSYFSLLSSSPFYSRSIQQKRSAKKPAKKPAGEPLGKRSAKKARKNFLKVLADLSRNKIGTLLGKVLNVSDFL
jgi:hypothetical protein